MGEAIDSAELREMLIQGESMNVEYKSTIPRNISDLTKEFVAFANTKGGTILIGVDDNSCLVGVKERPDDILQRLAGICRNNINPPINPPMGQITVDGCCIVWAKVAKEPKPRCSDDKYYIRVGTTVRPASPDELQKMFMPEDIRSQFLEWAQFCFKDFQAENHPQEQNKDNHGSKEPLEGEQKRRGIYEANHGLFLIHIWRPSHTSGQVADITIMIYQHTTGPLTSHQINKVEYFLGPKFSKEPFIKTNPDDNFRLCVSAYGPMLCLAKVHFSSKLPPIYLERYCDFYQPGTEVDD